MSEPLPEDQISGGVYTPSQPQLPILVILFKGGKYIAHKEVPTVAEGEAELAQALNELPDLEDAPDA